MGQFTSVSSPGITVTPIDRETGPGAGPGSSGNRDIYLGQDSATNSTLNDSIVLGYQAGDAGMADAHLNGTIIVGSQAAQHLLGAQGVPDSVAGCIILGLRAASALVYGNANIIFGQDTLTESPGLINAADQDNVIIGSYAVQFGTGRVTENVIIGHKAAQGGTFGFGNAAVPYDCVIIGSNACSGITHGNVGACVVIGYQAAAQLGSSLSGPQGHVIIGQAAAQFLQGGGDLVIIGQQTNVGSNTLYATAVGSTCAVRDSCVSIGAYAGGFAGGGGTPGLGSICIGAGAGGQLSNGAPWQLIIESYDVSSSTRRTGIYGDLAVGNIVLGGSEVPFGRDFGGGGTVNAIKIMPGAGAGGAPVVGGYFYYSQITGLHFIGDGGTDTIVAPP